MNSMLPTFSSVEKPNFTSSEEGEDCCSSRVTPQHSFRTGLVILMQNWRNFTDILIKNYKINIIKKKKLNSLLLQYIDKLI